MNIVKYNIKTNKIFRLSKHNSIMLNSIKINDDNNNIEDLEKLEIFIGNNLMWELNFSLLKLIDRIIIKNNKIIFPRDLLFRNCDYIKYIIIKNDFFPMHDLHIRIVSKKSINCKIKLIDNNLNENLLEIYQNKYMNDYYYYIIDNKINICNNRLNSIYIKGPSITNLYSDDPKYENKLKKHIIKKRIIYNTQNIRIIKTIDYLNLIKDIKNIIISYLNIYEYVYKIIVPKFEELPMDIDVYINKEYKGIMIIILDNELRMMSGMGNKLFYTDKSTFQ